MNALCVARLAELLAARRAAGVPDERLRLDVSIARGLDYYTGTVYETFFDELPAIGSVSSGGRYDNLAAVYASQAVPRMNRPMHKRFHTMKFHHCLMEFHGLCLGV